MNFFLCVISFVCVYIFLKSLFLLRIEFIVFVAWTRAPISHAGACGGDTHAGQRAVRGPEPVVVRVVVFFFSGPTQTRTCDSVCVCVCVFFFLPAR